MHIPVLMALYAANNNSNTTIITTKKEEDTFVKIDFNFHV